RGVALPGVPFDEAHGVIPNAGGRMLDGVDGTPIPGEYVVGWIKRGPQGIIGTNKPDAQETVEALLEDLAADHLREPYRPAPAAVEELLRRRKPDYVTYEDWQIIDAMERQRGAESGRARRKFARVEEMLDALAERKDAIEAADEALETAEAPERPGEAALARPPGTLSAVVVRGAGMRPAPVIAAWSSSGVASWPWAAPLAREMFSSMSVPPRSLQPAARRRAPPSRPSLTHEAWMLGMSPSKAILATACTST